MKPRIHKLGIVLSFFFLSLSLSVFAQKEAYNWVFGSNVKLDFNTSPPAFTPLTFGNSITPNVGFNIESSTSVSDAAGQLLFYTTGQYLYNGWTDATVSSTLATTLDASQGNLVIPMKSDPNKFLLFTVDATSNLAPYSCTGVVEWGSNRGSNYYTVTIDKTLKTVAVSAATNVISTSVIEGQAACPTNIDGVYWYVLHEVGGNRFKVYKVDTRTATPTVTFERNVDIGPNYAGCSYINLKFNSCYTQLAVAFPGTNNVSVYNFNTTTGDITSPQTFSIPGAYGLEFSNLDASGNSYFYVSQSEVASPKIYRGAVSATGVVTAPTVFASLGTNPDDAIDKTGHLQLGPDDNIYVADKLNYTWAGANDNFVGAILNPQTAGATFNPQYIRIKDNNSGFQYLHVGMGLPTFLKSLVTDDENVFISGVAVDNLNYCVGNTKTMSFISSGSVTNIPDWTITDPNNIVVKTATDSNTVNYTFNVAGTYTITLNYALRCTGNKTLTKKILVNPQVIPDFTFTCTGSSIPVTITGVAGVGGTPANYAYFNNTTGAYLGNGASITYNGAVPGNVRVEDYTPVTGGGPFTVQNSVAPYTWDVGQTPKATAFDALTDVLIRTVVVYPANWPTAGTYNGQTVKFIIKNSSGVQVGSTITYTFPSTAIVHTIPVYQVIPKGNNYTFEIDPTSVWNKFRTGNKPATPITQAGVFSFKGDLLTVTPDASQLGSGFVYSFNVAVPNFCRVPKVNTVACCVQPTPGIFVTSGSTTICEGSSATITATPSGTTATVYEWYKNGIVIPGQSSNLLTITNATLADSGNYAVKIKSSGSCAASSAFSPTIILKVSAVVGVPVFTSTNPSTLCQGSSSITYTATVTGGSGGTSGTTVFNQCPNTPTNCTWIVTSTANQTTPYTINGGQVLCIQSGTYTGTINGLASTGLIYVYPGAQFRPSSINNFNGGRIVMCGNSRLPSFSINANGSQIENYAATDVTGSINFNNSSSWINGLGANLNFQTQLTMDKLTFVNDGNISVNGSFTMNSTASNLFTNRDTLIANGIITLNGPFKNEGFLFADGANFIVNATGKVVNSCYFRSAGNFTYNGSDTMFVTGFTWSTGANNNFVLQGTAVSVTGEGWMQGANFSNNSPTKVVGNGNLLFSGTTVNQSAFGNDGKGLNFYDSGVPTGGKFFDTQNTNPHPSVTKNPITPRDGTFIPSTCSNIIKKTSIAYTLDAASIAAGNRIDPVTGALTLSPTYTGPITINAIATGCGPSQSNNVTVNVVPVVGTPAFVSGSTSSSRCQGAGTESYAASATNSSGISYSLNATSLAAGNTINTTTGVVTYVAGWSGVSTITVTAQGCNSSTSTSTHTATTVAPPLPTLIASGSTVCATATNATVTVAGTKVNEIYQAFLGATAIGSPVTSTGGNVSLTLPVSSLANGWNTISVRVTLSPCTPVTLNDTASVRVNPLPSATLTVTGSTVCSNTTNATVAIAGTRAGESYQAFLGAIPLGSAVTSTGGNVTLNVPVSPNLVVGWNTISVRASVGGCATVNLTDTAAVNVNSLPSGALAVSGSTVCATATNATVTISGTKAGEVYQAVFNSNNIGSPVTSTGGALTLNIPIATLASGWNTINVRSSIGGCATVNLTDTAAVRVNPLPSATLAVTGSTVCATATNATVTVAGTRVGEIYQAIYNSANIGTAVTSSGGTVTLNLPVVSLPTGWSTISVRASIGGCATVNLTDTASVKINPLPSATLVVTGSTICSNTANGTVSIAGTKTGESYQAFSGVTAVGSSVTSTGGTVTLNVPIASLTVGWNTISVRATIGGCGTVNITDTASIRVNTLPDKNLNVSGSVGCGNGSDAKVTITGTKVGEVYQAFKGAVAVGSSITSTGGNVELNVPVASLGVGVHTITVAASIGGCGSTLLTDTATIVVNSVPSTNLPVTGSTVCSTTTNATVTVQSTANGESYQAYVNGNPVGLAKISTGGTLTLNLPTATLGIGRFVVSVRSVIAGCGETSLIDTGLVIVNGLPSSALIVSGSTVCSNSPSATVTVAGTKAGETYQAFYPNNTTTIGSPVTSTGGTMTLSLPVSVLAIGQNTISVKASIAGCATVSLTDTGTVTVNPLPSGTLAVSGSTVCSNTTNATVTVTGTKIGEQYQAFVGINPVSSAISASAGSTSITIPVANLVLGSNTITVRSSIGGCVTVTLTNTATVIVNQLPSATLTLTGSTVCSNSGTATVTLANSQKDVSYQAFLGATAIGAPVVSTSNGSNVNLTLPLANLSAGLNVVSVTSSIAGCANVPITDTAAVIVNPLPSAALIATGSTVCSNSTNATVTVANTQKDVRYQAFIGATAVSTPVVSVSNGSSVTLTIAVSSLSVGLNVVTVNSSVAGCTNVAINDTAGVVLNNLPSASLTVRGSTVCSNSPNATVTVANTQRGVSYQAFIGTTAIGNAVASTTNGSTVTLSLPLSGLTSGLNIINVSSSVAGCTTVAITDTAGVILNTLPSGALNVSGSTVCSNSTSATVTIANTQKNVSYQSFVGAAAIGLPVVSNADASTVTLTLPVSNLSSGLNVVNVSSTIAGCAVVPNTDTAAVTVNPSPSASLTVRGSTVCSNNTSATVTIANTQRGVSYQAFVGTTTVGLPVVSATNVSTVTLTLPVSQLAAGLNIVSVTSSIAGCTSVTITDTAGVIVNTLPSASLTVTGSPICSSGTNATVTVANTQKDVRYQAFIGAVAVGAEVASISNGSTVSLSIPISSLSAGLNIVSVSSSIPGCAIIPITDTAGVIVNTLPSASTALTGSTVCSNSTFGTVTVNTTVSGISYQAFVGANAVGLAVTSTGTPVTLNLPVSSLPNASNTVTVQAAIPGCAAVTLTNTTTVIVNPLPDSTLIVTGSEGCGGGSDVKVTINGTRAGETYQAFKNGLPVGAPISSTGGTVNLFIPVGSLGIGTSTINVKASIAGCAIVALQDTATVIVNEVPGNNLTVTGSTVCSTDSLANVVISGTKAGDKYQAYVNNVAIGDFKISELGTTTLVLPTAALGTGEHIVTVRYQIVGCGEASLLDTGLVVINQLPSDLLKVTGDTICGSGTTAQITILGTNKKESYQAYKNNVPIGNPVVSNGGALNISLPVATLGIGKHRISVRVSIPGCGTINLKDSATVLVNPQPKPDLLVKGSTICSTSPSAEVTIFGTKLGELYQAYLNNNPIGTLTQSVDTTVTLVLPISSLSSGLNIVNVRSEVTSCAPVNLLDTAGVIVNPIPDSTLTVSGQTVCSNGTTANLRIFNTKIGERYQAYLNNNAVGNTVTSTGGTVVLDLPVSSLSTGLNVISVKANITACVEVLLKDTAAVIVNILPSDTLQVEGDTVCANSISARISVKGTSKGVSYQAYEDNTPLSNVVLSDGGDTVLTIPIVGSILTPGLHKIKIVSGIQECELVTLKNLADLLVNELPSLDMNVSDTTICSNTTTAFIHVFGTKPSETFVALLNNNPVSLPVVSAGGKVTLQIQRSDLALDTNVISIQTSISGCGNVLLNKTSTIVVNSLPKADLSLMGDTVCSSEALASLKIIGSEKNVTYSAYLGAVAIGSPLKSQGGDLVLSLPVFQLPADTNLVSVRASIGGCAEVVLNQNAAILKNKKPESLLAVNGSVVCSTSDTATATILKSDLKALYQAVLANQPIGQAVFGTGGDIVLKLPVNSLSADTNLVSFKASIGGCEEITLANKAKVVVNTLPADSLLTTGSTVCDDALSGTVTISNAQKNVSYQAYYQGLVVGNPVVSAGGNTVLTIPTLGLPKATSNFIEVKATIDQCAEVTLKSPATLLINPSVDNSIQIFGSSVCPGERARVTLVKSQVGVNYQMFIEGVPNSTAIGNGDTLVLGVPANDFPKSTNLVTFKANTPNCKVVDLAATTNVYILNGESLVITGPNLLCDSSKAIYTVSDIPGAIDYQWSLTNNVPIVEREGKRVIRVQFDTLSSLITVVPVGSFGACPNEGTDLLVSIEPPLSGKGQIVGLDTLCVRDTDTLSIVGMKGVSSYTWKWPNSFNLEILDTVLSSSVGLRYVVKYLEPGFQKIQAIPYSNCAQKNGDTLTKIVRVLDYATAEANSYEDVSMFGSLNAINLNGNGSSSNSASDKLNQFSYKWYSSPATPAQIANPNSLNGATITPENPETDVYLLVTNLGGRCPALDSAKIKVDYLINIPNVFSPNGDGVHDRWDILNINSFYPNAEVEVYNKWGSRVFRSAPGYPEPWDGTRNGQQLPVATYYYIIDLKNGGKPFVNSVTILR